MRAPSNLASRPLEALLPTHVRNLLGTTSPPEKVFANRELRMADVKAIGFDYDYTLASYTTELNAFIYDRAKEHLMERSHYPAIDTSYDPSFAIRGLLFDRRTGYLVKLSYARAVAQDAAFLGRRRLTTEELHRAYGPALHCDPHRVADDMSQSVWKSTSASGARVDGMEDAAIQDQRTVNLISTQVAVQRLVCPERGLSAGGRGPISGGPRHRLRRIGAGRGRRAGD